MPTAYHIKNNSTNAKYAPGNLFIPSDTAIIASKIWDKHDSPNKGDVQWTPELPGPPVIFQTEPPCDLAEPNTVWYGYPEVGYPATMKIPDTVYFDSTEKKVGAASVKLVTSRGYDLSLNYRPSNDSLAHWQLSSSDTLYFWIRTIKQPQYGFQYFSIRLGDDHGNYYKYNSLTSLLNAANLTWKRYKFPLTGNTQFLRSTVGQMSLDQVNYVEFHADTWDYGFTLWVDGVQFNPCSPITGVVESGQDIEPHSLFNYPNPFLDKTTISYDVPIAGRVKLEIFDLQGNRITTLLDEYKQPGSYELPFQTTRYSSGSVKKDRSSYLHPLSQISFIRLTTPEYTCTHKMVQIK